MERKGERPLEGSAELPLLNCLSDRKFAIPIFIYCLLVSISGSKKSSKNVFFKYPKKRRKEKKDFKKNI